MPVPQPASASRALLRRLVVGYGAVCVALWPIPVFGLLHAESAAVIAGVGCLMAATLTRRAWGEGGGLAASVWVHLGALVVPLALLTVSLVWRPNCGYLQGLGVFLLLVPPSVLFGIGVGWALPERWSAWAGGAVVLAIAVGGVLWDLLLHPQLFTYSHVFGGVLGPIYDVELAIRPGLWKAKAQTLVWAGWLISIGDWRVAPTRGAGIWVVGYTLLAALQVALAPQLGIVQTEAGIERVLSRQVDLGPVVLHLAPDTPEAEGARLAEELLFRFETTSAILEVAPSQPVQVYAYPDPETKAALIGSRETSVTPVWLGSPQIHMLADEVSRSAGHEMVHIVAREFGMPIIRASPAIGLVEGLAVALEPPNALPDATALVRAGLEIGAERGGLADAASVVQSTMSLRFWSAPAGIAYTVNGAFTRWLLDQYGAAPFRQAYRSGRFEAAYGRSLDDLSREWGAEVAAMPVDPEAVAVARWLFSRPSLFQLRCPHYVPPATRAVREGHQAWEQGDLQTAAAAYQTAVDADPFSLTALQGRLGTRLAQGHDAEAFDLQAATALADSITDASTLLHLADVRQVAGSPARATYQAARDSLAPVDAIGRFVLDRRRQLTPDLLTALLSAGPDRLGDGLAEGAPVLAALIHAQADRPGPAWDLARTWCLPDSATEAGRVGRWLQARLATQAGHRVVADSLLSGLDTAFERHGPRSYAARVRDDQQRIRWRLGPREWPAILAAPPATPDDSDSTRGALAPDCSAAQLASGERVRTP